MKQIRKVSQAQVFKHWEKVDNNRNQMIRDMLAKSTTWSLRSLELGDLKNLHIIQASDWIYDHKLALRDKTISDYSLESVYNQYAQQIKNRSDYPRSLEIFAREQGILEDLKKKKLPQKIVLVTLDNKNFVCYEGNRRMVAMYSLMKQKKFTMDQLEVYVGKSSVVNEADMPWYSVKPQDLLKSPTWKEILEEGKKKYIWYNSKRHIFSVSSTGKVTDAEWAAFCDLYPWNSDEWHLLRYESISGVLTPPIL